MRQAAGAGAATTLARRCLGSTGRCPALTHQREELGPGTDGGGAHAQRRGASAKCRRERREAPTQRGRAGRQGRRASRWAVGTPALARGASCCASSGSPRPTMRPAVCGGGSARICAIAPSSTPTTPPAAQPGQGASRNFQFLKSRRLPGYQGGWRRDESIPGGAGNVGDSQAS